MLKRKRFYAPAILLIAALFPGILLAQIEGKSREIVKMTCYLDGEIIYNPDSSLTVRSLELIDPHSLGQSLTIKAQTAEKIFGKVGIHGVYLMYSKKDQVCMAKNHEIITRFCSDYQKDPYFSYKKIYPKDSLLDANHPGPTDRLPELPGGVSALQALISGSLKYPDDARANSVLGRVVIGFIVNEDGSCSDIRAIGGRNLGILTSEALRIGGSLPRFFPGSRNGKPVKTFNSFCINFNLSANTAEEVE